MTAQPPADRAALRDRIAEAALAAVEAALGDTLLPAAREEALAGIVAVLPEPADRATELLTLADAYLTATHTARHDVIGEGGSCAGCALRAELRRMADETATETTGARCTCGGQFPINHLHADEHQPVAGARQDGAQQ